MKALTLQLPISVLLRISIWSMVLNTPEAVYDYRYLFQIEYPELTEFNDGCYPTEEQISENRVCSDDRAEPLYNTLEIILQSELDWNRDDFKRKAKKVLEDTKKFMSQEVSSIFL